jgi:hypothetical protein
VEYLFSGIFQLITARDKKKFLNSLDGDQRSLQQPEKSIYSGEPALDLQQDH